MMMVSRTEEECEDLMEAAKKLKYLGSMISTVCVMKKSNNSESGRSRSAGCKDEGGVGEKRIIKKTKLRVL